MATDSETATAPAPNPAASEPGLVGTWRIVKFEDRLSDGTVMHRFGDKPKGYLVYDPTGHVSVHLMRDPPLARFASGKGEFGTDAEKAAAYDAYVAYFGTYRIDRANHVLHHIVEGALDPFFTGTEQLRPYRLEGDTLILEVTGVEDGTHYYRELHRVR